MGIFGANQGRIDEIPLRVVVLSTAENLCIIRFPGVVDVGGDAVEGGLVDYRPHKGAEIGNITDLDLLDFRQKPFPELVPNRFGQVDAGSCRALLSLVFVGGSQGGHHDRFHVSRLMCKDEILAPRFTHDARVGTVVIDIVGDTLPEVLKGVGGTGKVKSGEVLAVEYWVAHVGARARKKVDDTLGQAGLFQQLHDKITGVNGGGRRFPERHVAADCRRGRQVSCYGGKVKRRYRKHESLQRPVFRTVPHSVGRVGLVSVYLRQVVPVEAVEVDQFGHGIDFRLVGRLRLAQHGRRIELVAPRAGNQVCGFFKDRHALFPRHFGPLPSGFEGGVDRHLHFLFTGEMDGAQHVAVVVRHHHVGRPSGRNFLTADNGRDLRFFLCKSVEFLFQRFPFGCVRCVGFYRFVKRFPDLEVCISHNELLF